MPSPLIENKTEESHFLDYKETISLAGTKNKRELCKDVSSFANERGGVLIYGVPEEKLDGVPVPKDLSECGMPIPAGLPEQIETILVGGSVVPPLPETIIKVLTVDDKSLLVIYHPESWAKPHMIEGQNRTFRYYCRGEYCSRPMKESEVEAAYLFRKVSRAHAEEFFKTVTFAEVPEGRRFLRIILCPNFTVNLRSRMQGSEFFRWLCDNRPGGSPGAWTTFLDGWCFFGATANRFRTPSRWNLWLCYNGAISLDYDLSAELNNDTSLYLEQVESYVIQNIFLNFAKVIYENFSISGPITIKMVLANAKGLIGLPSGRWKTVSQDIDFITILGDSINFLEEASASELMFDLETVTNRLMTRLANAFGLW